MEYFAETEKAVKLELVVDFYNLERGGRFKVWVPKSQLDEYGWPKPWISARKVEEVGRGKGGATLEMWVDANNNGYRPETYISC